MASCAVSRAATASACSLSSVAAAASRASSAASAASQAALAASRARASSGDERLQRRTLGLLCDPCPRQGPAKQEKDQQGPPKTDPKHRKFL
jgi:hypothetical protein